MCCLQTIATNGQSVAMLEPLRTDGTCGCAAKRGCVVRAESARVSCPTWGRERTRDDGYYCHKDLYLQIQTVSVLYQGCFFYDGMTSAEAKSVLQYSAVGTYLVRNSSNPRFLYTISVKTKRGPTSIRVLYENGRFSLDADERSKRYMPTFTNFLCLIDFYVRAAVSGRKSDQCRFLDKTGKKDLPIVLTKPKLNAVPTLKHLSRVTINKTLPANSISEVRQLVDKLPIPPLLKSTLKDYPYTF